MQDLLLHRLGVFVQESEALWVDRLTCSFVSAWHIRLLVRVDAIDHTTRGLNRLITVRSPLRPGYQQLLFANDRALRMGLRKSDGESPVLLVGVMSGCCRVDIELG